MQIENGQFHRVYPEEPGTLTCHPEFVQTITIDPSCGRRQLGWPLSRSRRGRIRRARR